MKRKAAKKAPARPQSTDVAVVAKQGDTALALVERFARDKDFDVAKMQALLDMRDREMARLAEHDFNLALNQAQAAMRPIATDADNKQTSSRYATYRKLDAAIRPIYTGHGFGISFDTADSPKGVDYVRVRCYVSHAGGYSRTYQCDMPADGKGAKGGDVMTKTHATGAAMSYGMRYLLKMIFNISIGEEDRDGNRVESPPLRKSRQQAPPDIDYAPEESSQLEAPEPITVKQWERIAEISKRAGRDDAEVKLWLKKSYGVKNLKDIPRTHYAAICQQLEARGALVFPGDGQ